MRNLGFEKDVVVQELDIWKTVRERKIATFNEIVEMTSLSKEGFFARVVAFLTGGSISASTLKLSNILGEASLSDILKDTNISDQIKTLTALSSDVFSFILGGIIALVAFVIFVRLIRDGYVEKVMGETLVQQDRHWRRHVRISFRNRLITLSEELIRITKDNYDLCSKDILDYNKDKLLKYIDELIPEEKLYRAAWDECDYNKKWWRHLFRKINFDKM